MAQTNILRVKLFQNNHYQTTRPFSGEIPAGRSFRRPYRKGSTCSHPEHSSQAFRADDSAYQRESRYCRIFKTPLLFTAREFFYAPTAQHSQHCVQAHPIVFSSPIIQQNTSPPGISRSPAPIKTLRPTAGDSWSDPARACWISQSRRSIFPSVRISKCPWAMHLRCYALQV